MKTCFVKIIPIALSCAYLLVGCAYLSGNYSATDHKLDYNKPESEFEEVNIKQLSSPEGASQFAGKYVVFNGNFFCISKNYFSFSSSGSFYENGGVMRAIIYDPQLGKPPTTGCKTAIPYWSKEDVDVEATFSGVKEGDPVRIYAYVLRTGESASARKDGETLGGFPETALVFVRMVPVNGHP